MRKELTIFLLVVGLFFGNLLAQVSGVLFYRAPTKDKVSTLQTCPSVPGTIPAAVGTNVIAGDTTGAQNETSVAVNPLNPANIVVGLNDYPGVESQAGFRTSFDSGRTWQTGRLSLAQLPRSWAGAGDPAVAFDKLGNVYFVCIAFNRDIFGKATDVSILIYRSTDGGFNWVFRSVIEDGFAQNPIQDKPYLAIDTISTDSKANRIYVAWTKFAGATRQILLEYSINGGGSFTPSMVPLADTSIFAIGALPAVDRLGNVFVTWAQGSQILIRRSVDGGVNFAPAVEVAVITTVGLAHLTGRDKVPYVSGNGDRLVGWTEQPSGWFRQYLCGLDTENFDKQF